MASTIEHNPPEKVNKLFCFGGAENSHYDLSTVSVMNPTTGEWSDLTPMLSPRCASGGAVIGSKVYLCGGWNIGDQFYIELDRAFNHMEVYDCSTDSWTKLSPMPQPGKFIGVAALDGFIYVTGFLGASRTAAYRYCTKTDQWSTIKDTLAERHGHNLIELNGFLYAIGGAYNKSVERYDPQADEWTMVATPRTAFRYGCATAHKGKIYVHMQNRFEVYTPETNSWKVLRAAMLKYIGSSLVSVGDKLWLLGGGEKFKKCHLGSAEVYEYDTRTDQWSELPDRMDRERYYHCSFVVNC